MLQKLHVLEVTKRKKKSYQSGQITNNDHRHRRKRVPAPIPVENSIHSPVATSNVVPRRLRELRMLHSLRRARKAAISKIGSPVKRDNAPISRISEPEFQRRKSATITR